MRFALIICCLLVSWVQVWAQETTFFHRIHTGTDEEGPAAIIQADTGYIILASGPVPNTIIHRGIKLVKVDEAGTIDWVKEYGQPGRFWFPGLWGNLVRTLDGHYAFGGNCSDSSNFRTPLIMKFTENGDTLWTHKFPQSGTSVFFDVVQTPDSGLAFSGFLRFPDNAGRDDYLLLKTDADGNFLWQQTYGWFFGEMSTSLALTQDSGLLMGGGKI